MNWKNCRKKMINEIHENKNSSNAIILILHSTYRLALLNIGSL